jgi:hypothetical protein
VKNGFAACESFFIVYASPLKELERDWAFYLEADEVVHEEDL